MERQSKMKVYCYTKKLELLVTFESTAQCARELGLSQGNVVLTCQGVLPSYHGMYMSYTPLKSQEDVEKLHQEGKAKKAKRDEQVDNAQIGYRARNREKLAKNALAWYYRNREKVIEYQKERYRRLKNEREKLQNISGTAS